MVPTTVTRQALLDFKDESKIIFTKQGDGGGNGLISDSS